MWNVRQVSTFRFTDGCLARIGRFLTRSGELADFLQISLTLRDCDNARSLRTLSLLGLGRRRPALGYKTFLIIIAQVPFLDDSSNLYKSPRSATHVSKRSSEA